MSYERLRYPTRRNSIFGQALDESFTSPDEALMGLDFDLVYTNIGIGDNIRLTSTVL